MTSSRTTSVASTATSSSTTTGTTTGTANTIPDRPLSGAADTGYIGLGLRANAAFSLLTGALLAAAPSTVGGWLGVDIDGWLRLLGLALLGHAAILWWAQSASQPRPASLTTHGLTTRGLARLNLAMIAPYPLLMVGLAAFGLVDTGLGRVLVLADGAIVGAIAVVHAIGLRSTAPAAESVYPANPNAATATTA